MHDMNVLLYFTLKYYVYSKLEDYLKPGQKEKKKKNCNRYNIKK